MDRIRDNDEVDAVEVGKPAPDFGLYDQNGEAWQLSSKRGKVVALVFYPKDETIVCTRQLCSLRDRWEDYVATKAVVVAISPDTVESHKKFTASHRLPLPLLSDTGSVVARKYTSHWLYPHSFTRGLVVIDAEGIVRGRKVMPRIFRPIDSSVIAIIRMAQLARYGIAIPGWSDKSA